MTQITEKQRDDLKSLLEDHQAVTDALTVLGRAGFVPTIMLISEDTNESYSIGLPHAEAKRSFVAVKAWVEKKLGELGIEVK